MRSVGAALAAMALALVACSGSGGGTADGTTVPPITTVESEPTRPVTTLAVTVPETLSPTTAELDETVFSFARDDLCEWVTTDEVADMVSAVYPWDGEAEITQQGNQVFYPIAGCQWALPDGVSIGNLSVIDGLGAEVFGGQAVVDYSATERLEVGVAVSGHPALGGGVVVQLEGYGWAAFWVPPLEESLIVGVLGVPGVVDPFEEDRFFLLADALLRELGWIPTSRAFPDSAPQASGESVEAQSGCHTRWVSGLQPPSTVCVDPPIVRAEVGATEVVVTGSDFAGFSSLFVYSCPIDPPCDEPSGDGALARKEGRLVNLTLEPDGTFSTPLVVNIDDAVIEQGGLAIVAGDIWIPSAGRTELQVRE